MRHLLVLLAVVAGVLPREGSAAVSECLLDAQGTLSISSASVPLGGATTLSWSVSPGSGCGPADTLRQFISGVGEVPRSGSAVVSPTANRTYLLRAQAGTKSKVLKSVAVSVSGSLPAGADGRPQVRIDSNAQQELFALAVQTPNADVRLADDLNMNLTGLENLEVASGVHIIGGRSSTKPGPRLYTTQADVGPATHQMFVIGEHNAAQNVKITGIRLDGGVMDVRGCQSCINSDGWNAIAVYASAYATDIDVDISHNEIYGWPGRGITVVDKAGKLGWHNASAVHVHDNYIHHIRHWRRLGYGVQANEGAYVLIERNVFDYNRHAIEASAAPGTGYIANANLLLGHGGENAEVPLVGLDLHTHQFDVHGSEDGLLTDSYYGRAGEYFEFRDNTLLYTKTTPIKVRGRPTMTSYVVHNAFALPRPGAVVQTEGDNLEVTSDNRFSVMPSTREAICDFDGDGRLDTFMATGVTWWFKGATDQWVYMNTATEMPAELTFQDFNGDGRCEVRTSSELPRQTVDVLWRKTDGALALWHDGVASWSTPFGASDNAWQVLGVGDFDGGGRSDILWRRTADGRLSLWYDSGRALDLGPLATVWAFAGIGDFNGNGKSDILWRNKVDGSAVVWYDAGFGGSVVLGQVDNAWQTPGIGDFNGNGKSDILWRNKNDGTLAVWYDAGYGGSAVLSQLDNVWQVSGVGDFDDNGKSDILWRNTSDGTVSTWYDAGFGGSMMLGQVDSAWQVSAVCDFDGNGMSDILWRNTDGAMLIWHDAGFGGVTDPGSLSSDWKVQGVGKFD